MFPNHGSHRELQGLHNGKHRSHHVKHGRLVRARQGKNVKRSPRSEIYQLWATSCCNVMQLMQGGQQGKELALAAAPNSWLPHEMLIQVFGTLQGAPSQVGVQCRNHHSHSLKVSHKLIVAHAWCLPKNLLQSHNQTMMPHQLRNRWSTRCQSQRMSPE